MSTNQITNYFAALVDELVQCGASSIVISPGSRSTPLALFFYESQGFSSEVAIDERSAAFLALGHAKRLQKPVVLLCTSGSAAANYYPAIVEANLARVPLIVITADRPQSLQNFGAAQTMNQDNLYGTHVVHYCAIGEQLNSLETVKAMRNFMKEAYSVATEKKGVAHINAYIEEPLIPSFETVNYGYGREDSRELRCINHLQTQQNRIHTNEGVWLKDKDLKVKIDLIEQLISGKKVLLCCGQDDNSKRYHTQILKFSEKLGIPIIADPLSNLRQYNHSNVITAYDSFLMEKNREKYCVETPDVIIRFGAFPVSKRFLTYVLYNNIDQIVIDGINPNRNPAKNTILAVNFDELLVLNALLETMQQGNSMDKFLSHEQSVLKAGWCQCNKAMTQHILTQLKAATWPYEGLALCAAMENFKGNIVLANSMTIRYCDFFYHGSHLEDETRDTKSLKPVKNSLHKTPRSCEHTLFCNRGVNGIDGTVSTALGIARAKKECTLLLTGDLAFIHDINALLYQNADFPVVIVVFNNHGGGIFSYLPQKKFKSFEALFETPQNVDIGKIVQGYGHSYEGVESLVSFKEKFTAAVNRKGITVIEIQVNRDSSFHISNVCTGAI